MSKTRQLIRDFKSELVVAIFVSLVTAFLLRLGSQVLGAMPAIAQGFGMYIKTLVIQLAATKSTFALVYNLSSLMFSFMVGSTMGIVLGIIRGLYRREKKLKSIEMKKEDVVDMRKSHKKKVNAKILLVLVLFSHIFLFVLFGIEAASSYTYGAFDHSMIELKYYIGDSQVSYLQSEWSQMKTYDDYTQINNSIETYRAQYLKDKK